MKKKLLLITLLCSVFMQSQEVWTTYNSSNSELTFDEIEDIAHDSQGNTWVSSWYNHGGEGIAKFDGTNWIIFNSENSQTNSLNFNKIEFSSGEVEQWVSISAVTTVSLSDGSQTIINSEHDYTTNILTIQVPEGAISVSIDYYIEDSSVSVEKVLLNDDVVVSEETISNENNYTFNYGVSERKPYQVNFNTTDLDNNVAIAVSAIINYDDGTQSRVCATHDYDSDILSIDIPTNVLSFEIDYFIEDTSQTVDVEMKEVSEEATVLIQETFSGQKHYEFNHEFTNENSNENTIPTDQTRFITIDSNDNVWVGTYKEGILKYDGNTWVQYTASNSELPYDYILSIATDNDDNVWIGTAYGLTKFDGENWTNYQQIDDNLTIGNIFDIAIDESGVVWMLSNGSNLISFDGSSWDVYNDTSEYHYFGKLVIDESGKKWMTDGSKLTSFDGTLWESFYHDSGVNNDCLTDCQPISLAVDLDNNLWVGQHLECEEGGLSNFTQCNNYLTSNSDLPDGSILSLAIDQDGTKWIGTFNGVAKLETTSSTLNVNAIGLKEGEVLYYPNPSKNFITLEVENSFIGASYKIFDIAGKKVKNGIIEKNTQLIDLTNLESQMYFIKLMNGSLEKTIKIVK